MKRINTKFVKTASDNGTELKVSVYFTNGDIRSHKGLYISVVPVVREYVGNITIEKSTAYSGIKECLLPMPRWNEKRANTFVVPAETEAKLIGYVCEKNDLRLC